MTQLSNKQIERKQTNQSPVFINWLTFDFTFFMRSNTFQPKHPMTKNPDKPNSDKDFDTYSVQSKMSYQKQPQTTNNTVSNNQKMTKSILETLKKIYKDTEKSISAAGFKPTQKTLLSTIAAFFNSFDNAFDESSLTIEMIPDIFKGVGYPNTISKTYFQPVGAPHTWGQCLAIMEWLGELASFHVDMRNCLEQQGGFHQDFTSILIRSYIENDPKIAKKYLDGEIERKSKAIEGFKYNINTMNIEIENQKAAQKSLKELDEEHKILEQILYRETQEAIQIQHQNSQLDKKLRQVRNKVKEQEMVNDIHENEIVSLTNEVQNQQLSVEQVQRIRFQIKETREKITQLKRYEQRQKQILDKTDEFLVNEYMEFNKTLEVLRHMYRKHKYEMDVRNIYMNIPECDVTNFREFLKDRKQQCADVEVESILGINEIRDIKEKADSLLALVDQEMRSLDAAKQQISAENNQVNEQCLDKEMQNSEQEMKIGTMRSKISGIQNQIQNCQLQNSQIVAQIKFLENNKKTFEEQQNLLLDVAQEIIQEVTEWGEMNKTFKTELDQTLESMSMDLIDFKVKAIQSVNHFAEIIQEFNQDLGFSELIERRNKQKENGANHENGEQNESEKIEQENGENEEKEEREESIQIMRGSSGRNADDEYDYRSLLGQGAYQSPKAEKVNRMLQKGYKP